MTLHATPDAVQDSTRRAAARGWRVLLVEDDAEIAALLTHYLQRHGIDVVAARDGETAWRCFVDHAPDVVVTDLLLPKLGGRELVGRIRGHPVHGRLPIAVMTATVNGQTEEEALRQALHVDVVCRKPLPLREFLHRLDGLVHAWCRKVRPGVTSEEARSQVHPPAPAVQHARARPATQAGVAALPPLEGEATTASLSAVALYAFEYRLSVVLEVRDGTVTRRLGLRDGVVVNAASTDPAESLARRMLDAGLVDEGLVRRIGQLTESRNTRFAEYAVWGFEVPSVAVARAVEQQLLAVASATLAAGRGRFVMRAWEENPVLAARGLLDPVHLIQRACVERIAPVEAVRLLAPMAHLRLLRGPAFDERMLLFTHLRPTSTLPCAIAGDLTVRAAMDIASEYPCGLPELLALVLSGAVHVGNHASVLRTSARSAVLGVMRDEWSLDGAATRFSEPVCREWIRTCSRPPHEILRVPEDAPDSAIEAAYDGMVCRFGPPALDDADLGPAKRLLEVVRARRDEARRILLGPANASGT